VVLSHDKSSWCSVVASPPPSDAVPALWRVSTPLMRAAVCVIYVSAVKHRRVAVLHGRPLRHSRAAVVSCQALVGTCMASLSSCCDLRERRSVADLCAGMTASGTCGLSGCVVWESLAHGVVREL
jgi:hypothetical protein